MAYDEGVAQRVRDCLAEQPGMTEMRMFGGIAFATERDLRGWLGRCLSFTRSLAQK